MTTEFDDLDALFETAAQQRPQPSPGLTARILVDADALQPQPAAPQVRPSARPMGWLDTLSDWFGGRTSLAGMSVAALTGLYLGVAQPTPILALTQLVTGQVAQDSLELLPASETLWAME